MREVALGWAAVLTVKWHGETDLSLLNVYAPNDTRKNEDLWGFLHQWHRDHHLPASTVMLGDFNLVEEAINCVPAKESPQAPVAALCELLTALHLHDGWHITEPLMHDFTFPQRTGGHRSRLNRIYLTAVLLNLSFEWSIEQVPC